MRERNCQFAEDLKRLVSISESLRRSYADYDTVLAARLVHFLLAESSGLGHPARVVDMGCGRGSYVEFFKSWGLPVVGIDGNAVITRSIRFNSFLYDLTTPLDLKEALGTRGSLGICWRFGRLRPRHGPLRRTAKS